MFFCSQQVVSKEDYPAIFVFEKAMIVVEFLFD